MLLVLQISFLAILLLIGRQQDQKRGADENAFSPISWHVFDTLLSFFLSTQEYIN